MLLSGTPAEIHILSSGKQRPASSTPHSPRTPSPALVALLAAHPTALSNFRSSWAAVLLWAVLVCTGQHMSPSPWQHQPLWLGELELWEL